MVQLLLQALLPLIRCWQVLIRHLQISLTERKWVSIYYMTPNPVTDEAYFFMYLVFLFAFLQYSQLSLEFLIFHLRFSGTLFTLLLRFLYNYIYSDSRCTMKCTPPLPPPCTTAKGTSLTGAGAHYCMQFVQWIMHHNHLKLAHCTCSVHINKNTCMLVQFICTVAVTPLAICMC